MDNLKLKEIVFTKEKNKKIIRIDYNFSYLKIIKIILKSHIDKQPDEWAQVFSETSIELKLKNINGSSKTDSFNLLQFISLYQKLPIIELNAEFPDNETRKYLTNSNFYNNVELTFFIKKEKEIFNLYYIEMPGLHIIE
ncbi:MAG: hypothetical protein HY951_03180 [Bacteroidia bacterium]|nr:hypothetical protein [Bacteroidia bacterium]